MYVALIINGEMEVINSFVYVHVHFIIIILMHFGVLILKVKVKTRYYTQYYKLKYTIIQCAL